LETLVLDWERNSLISFLLKIVTGIVLAVAIGFMHFIARKLGYSLQLKTQGFVLNLFLLGIYSASIIIFYVLLRNLKASNL
jgi:hypothetical protein